MSIAFLPGIVICSVIVGPTDVRKPSRVYASIAKLNRWKSGTTFCVYTVLKSDQLHPIPLVTESIGPSWLHCKSGLPAKGAIDQSCIHVDLFHALDMLVPTQNHKSDLTTTTTRSIILFFSKSQQAPVHI